jgi:DNA-binding MarR family transcriptional regulator
MRICAHVEQQGFDDARGAHASVGGLQLLCRPLGGQACQPVLRPVPGLRTTQFSILAKLKRLGPQSINTLAESMVMDRTTLGRNILPLERDGLIRIEPAASDRRAKELHLTKAGEKRLQAALKGWMAAQAQFESAFGAARAADLLSLLRARRATPSPPPREALS